MTNKINHPIIFLDTSFKSKYCSKDKKKEWDEAIQACSDYIPFFDDSTYLLCSTSAGILEDIGLGKFREENKEYLKLPQNWRYFFDQKTIANGEPRDKDAFQRLYLEAEKYCAAQYITEVKKHISRHFRAKLTQRFLRRQAIVTVRKYPFHPYSCMVQKDIKVWRKELDDSAFYNEFIEDLVWDTVFRYPYINSSQIRKIDIASARSFYCQIYHNLAKIFLEFHGKGYNRSCLSLFASIEQFHYKLENPQLPKLELLRPWDDILDPELSYFSTLGYYKAGKRYPVIVLISENQEMVEMRLRSQNKSLQELNTHGYPVDGVPGYLINFDPHDKLKSHFIDLSKF